MRNQRATGFTLAELIIVVAIIGIISGIAIPSFQTFRKRYDAESQVRRMHVDMMRARQHAFQQNKICFVSVTDTCYQIIEDTNDSGGTEPDEGDTILWPEPRQFQYPSHWNGTVILGGRGLISKSTGAILSSNPLSIRFDMIDAYPRYDCISVGPTRLNVGKWNGSKCQPM